MFPVPVVDYRKSALLYLYTDSRIHRAYQHIVVVPLHFLCHLYSPYCITHILTWQRADIACETEYMDDVLLVMEY